MKEARAEEIEEENDAMKILENRTKESKKVGFVLVLFWFCMYVCMYVCMDVWMY